MKNPGQIIYCLFFLPIWITSCTESSFADIQRKREEPRGVPLTVTILKENNTISLEWEKDPLVDEYRLQGQNQGKDYNTIYQGTDSRYKDRNVPDNTWRLYQLSARRGNKWFESPDTVVGVGSDNSIDRYEPNDSREDAVELEVGTLVASIHAYANSGIAGFEPVIDNDWYMIELYGGYQATIAVNEIETAPGFPTKLAFQVSGEITKDIVKNSDTNTIKNSSDQRQFVRFRITASSNNFTPPPSRVTFIGYELKISTIIKIP